MRTRNIVLSTLVLLSAFVGDVAAYLWLPKPSFWAELLTDLDYVAIVFVAVNFGPKGGLIAAVIAGIGHGAVKQLGSGRPVTEQGEFAIFLLVGILAGVLERFQPRRAAGLESNKPYSTSDDHKLVGSVVEHAASFGQMSSMLMHELRTRLASIQGANAVLAETSLSVEERREFDAIIRRECQRLKRLVDLIDSDHVRASEYRDVDVASVLDEVFRRSEELRTHRLRRECPGGLRPLHCNPDLIQQALLSLTENAMQATKPGGEIVLSAQSNNDRLYLEVKDQRFVGEPPGRTSGPLDGRGEPGFAVIREIVARHGGTLGMKQNGDGVITCMTLPYHPN